MKSKTSIKLYDKNTEITRAVISKLGAFRWHWIYYPDPTMCKSTDPHGVAPFKFVAKWQIRLAMRSHKA